jgi:hypothetical protein
LDEIGQISPPASVGIIGKDADVPAMLQPFGNKAEAGLASLEDRECGIALGSLPAGFNVAVHEDKAIPFRPHGIG